MARRTELLADGFAQAGERHRVGALELVQAWVKYTERIPATFALGCAQHESDLTLNEQDTEDSGYTSIGVYQLSRGEGVAAGLPLANLLDLDDSSTVMATIMERNLDRLLATAGVAEGEFWARGGAGYLAWSHNAGLGGSGGKHGPMDSIAAYGLDWDALAARPQSDYMRTRMIPYGYDCITGGKYWSDDLASVQAAPGASPGFGRRLAMVAALAGAGVLLFVRA